MHFQQREQEKYKWISGNNVISVSCGSGIGSVGPDGLGGQCLHVKTASWKVVDTVARAGLWYGEASNDWCFSWSCQSLVFISTVLCGSRVSWWRQSYLWSRMQVCCRGRVVGSWQFGWWRPGWRRRWWSPAPTWPPSAAATCVRRSSLPRTRGHEFMLMLSCPVRYHEVSRTFWERTTGDVSSGHSGPGRIYEGGCFAKSKKKVANFVRYLDVIFISLHSTERRKCNSNHLN